jgi:DNA-directed RNA polymerase alpha subunit
MSDALIRDLKLSAPAHRALANAGYTTLEQLSRISEKQLLALHGVGPKALPELRSALADAGLSFAEG